MGSVVSAKFVGEYKPNITKEKISKRKVKLKQSFKRMPKEIGKRFLKEFTQMSSKESNEMVTNYIIAEEIPKYVEKMVSKLNCEKKEHVSWKPVLSYCEGKEWSDNTTLPMIGYHGTSLEFSNKIIENGFKNHSLFTHSSIYQTLQVGERHGESYVVLLCLFNTKKLINYEEMAKLKGDNDWEKFNKKLEKLKIDGVFQDNIDTIQISNRKNISTFGYIKYEKGVYKLYFF